MSFSRVSSEQPKPSSHPFWEWCAYLVIGTLFGIVLIKSEVVSWFRIQEMFRFQSFFMFGVLGSAVATAALAIRLTKASGWRALNGDEIEIAAKLWQPGSQHRYWIGGTIFGVGWGLAGVCPGPIYALLGAGVSGAVVVLIAALAGTRLYAAVRHKLPH